MGRLPIDFDEQQQAKVFEFFECHHGAPLLSFLPRCTV